MVFFTVIVYLIQSVDAIGIVFEINEKYIVLFERDISRHHFVIIARCTNACSDFRVIPMTAQCPSQRSN